MKILEFLETFNIKFLEYETNIILSLHRGVTKVLGLESQGRGHLFGASGGGNF